MPLTSALCRSAAAALCLLAGLPSALAQTAPTAPTAPEPAASAPDVPASAPRPPTRWEGAIGLILHHEPSYSGSGEMVDKAVPAFYLRYGRFTITNASVFVTRRQDDVLRGASADLLRSDTLRVNLALRVDNGRRETASDRLTGLGEVKRTVRGRLSLGWNFAPDWRLSLGLSPDLLGHGGGTSFDAGVVRDFRLGPRSVVSLGTGLTYGNARNLQSYYGVTPEQSARTGYAVYTPGAGLTGTSVSLGWRGDINERWTAFATGSASRMLGPVLDSPIVTGTRNWSVSSGLAWRF
ncbi:outer membrane protein V [Burkholderiales bacterium JOSHI_001]|nr:outer membrane protein V [Burkholderiales bacterium JOSHI_001]